MYCQTSNKSKVYHRSECRFINRMDEDSVIYVHSSEARSRNLRPCKCCCNLKKIYNDLKPEIKTIFDGFEVKTKYESEYVHVDLPLNRWRILLREADQIMKLYHVEPGEGLYEEKLARCYELKNTKKLSTVMEFIAKEEKVAMYPKCYKTVAEHIEETAQKKGVDIEFDGNKLYVLTDMAAWKVTYADRSGRYLLMHSPFDGQPLSMEDAKNADYHRQVDVPKKQSAYGHLIYIIKHDEAKKIEKVDYRKLPHNTRKEKKYYHQAKNRAKRESVNRMWEIFDELEKKR